MEGFQDNSDIPTDFNPPSHTEDVEASSDVIDFINRIANATADADLPKGVDGEKFLVLSRNAEGDVIVSGYAILGPNGGDVSSLIDKNTIAIVHVHPSDAITQRPHGGDHTAVTAGGISSFVISSSGRTVYEVGQTGGTVQYRTVSGRQPGRWRNYRSDVSTAAPDRPRAQIES